MKRFRPFACLVVLLWVTTAGAALALVASAPAQDDAPLNLKDYSFRAHMEIVAAAVGSNSAWALGPKPNFSGRWKARIPESDFGPFPKPVSFIQTVEHDSLHLTLNVESVDRRNKKHTDDLWFALDGQESVNDVEGRPVRGFARRLGRHLLLHTSRVQDGVEINLDELWTLSEDGQTLTVDAAVTTSMGDADLRVVFEREDDVR